VQTGNTKLAKVRLIAAALQLVQMESMERVAVVVAVMHVIRPSTAQRLQTLNLNEQRAETVDLV
jgi:hypothetical protein